MQNKDALNKIRSVLPGDDVLAQCMHCGMCLAVCPTYDLTKLERSSPRGRIKMIKSLAEGELQISETFIEEMSFCLDCQACETACPAGVRYGSMVESARVLVMESGKYPKLKGLFQKIGLNYIIANKTLLSLFAFIMALFQKSGILNFISQSSFFRKNFPGLCEAIRLSPVFEFLPGSMKSSSFIPAEAERKFTVAFLSGCLMDTAFSSINEDTIYILKKNNCDVIIPRGQVCCGSLHAHNGEIRKAKELARKNLDVFSKNEYDFLVSNSAGCGAFMKEYGHLFEDDNEYAEKASKFSSKVLDITEFLARFGLKNNLGTISDHITYHDACHLCHTQKITKEPREVLSKIPGIKNSALNDSTWCCGSAGIYNVTRYDDSMKFLQRKMNNIKLTGAEVVITGNPGCMLQIKYGAEKFGVNVKVEHPASLVARAYRQGETTVSVKRSL